MAAMPPLFSVIIVSLNGAPVIRRVLDSLRATDYPRFEVIVVDNGSTDGMGEIVREEYPEVRLIQSPINLGFAGGNNLGIRKAEGDILVLLNDDTRVRPRWLRGWERATRDYPDWGVLGCKLLYPDERTIQHAGGWIEPTGNSHHFGQDEIDEGQHDQVRECDYVTGAALAIRREAIDRLGPLDERYFPIYFEETDYCWQVRQAGWRVLYVPDAVVIHDESRTQGRASFRFLFRYARCRMRYLLKTCTGRELLRAAWHELKWWRHLYNSPCYLPFLCAYGASLGDLPRNLIDRYRFRQRMARLRGQ